MQRMLRIAPLFLILAFSACLENEEELEVHEDGSVTVRVAAKGDLGDLANGYPVPLDTGWRILGEDTAEWLRQFGADTGSAAVQARVGEVEWPGGGEGEEAEPRLMVERDFAAVADLPEWFAPPTEPYRTAFLRRTTRLDVRAASGRKVYVFERVFHDRRQGVRDALDSCFEGLPVELRDKFEHKEPLLPGDWKVATEAVRAAFADAGEQFAHDALEVLYTKGDASLDPRAVPAVLRAVREAAGASFAPATLVAVYELGSTRGNDSNLVREGEEEESRLLRAMEEGLHQAVRDSLQSSLRREGVEESTRNAILFGLEWGFTSYAHSDDIQDEKFRVRVTLPGILVAGNYASIEDGAAFWEFEGEELAEHDLVLRAVSVLE